MYGACGRRDGGVFVFVEVVPNDVANIPAGARRDHPVSAVVKMRLNVAVFRPKPQFKVGGVGGTRDWAIERAATVSAVVNEPRSLHWLLTLET